MDIFRVQFALMENSFEEEIFSVNGRSVAGLTHSEAIGIFKETKIGTIQVTIGRREGKKIVQIDGADQC